MAIQSITSQNETYELITNSDLITAAHSLLDGIELDPASSVLANTYVQADNFFTPTDDGMNEKEWYGSVYVFPPHGTYFWDKKQQRWRITRTACPSVISSHALWFRKMYRSWLDGSIKQGLYFTNCPDMIRYEQRIFDFPMCILRTPPLVLIHRGNGVVQKHKTCTSMLVYLPPVDSPSEATEKFISIYERKGRLLV